MIKIQIALYIIYALTLNGVNTDIGWKCLWQNIPLIKKQKQRVKSGIAIMKIMIMRLQTRKSSLMTKSWHSNLQRIWPQFLGNQILRSVLFGGTRSPSKLPSACRLGLTVDLWTFCEQNRRLGVLYKNTIFFCAKTRKNSKTIHNFVSF